MTRLFAGTPFDIPPTCQRCGQPEDDCTCTAEQKAELEVERQRQADRLPPEEQRAKVSVQKRKGGRKVTVVEGLTTRANDLPSLLSTLQTDCGTGGTVKAKEDRIELQGDHADSVRQSLRQLGFRL